MHAAACCFPMLNPDGVVERNGGGVPSSNDVGRTRKSNKTLQKFEKKSPGNKQYKSAVMFFMKKNKKKFKIEQI